MELTGKVIAVMEARSGVSARTGKLPTRCKMKKLVPFLAIASLLLASCEYFGSFTFAINNRTEDTLYVTYTPQLRTSEDILPTYHHGRDYEYVRLRETDSTIVIPPYSGIEMEFDVGLVSSDFPEKGDTPERWHIVPLWTSIACIVVGTDTMDCSSYAEERWERAGSTYTLNIAR